MAKQKWWWKKEETDLVESDYYTNDDWGYGKKVSTLDENGKKKKNEFNDAWKDYTKSGVWKGYDYYKKPTLGYRYIQQIANTLAAQYKIDIEVGNTWEVDLEHKKLTYNPITLMYGTKGELLATLLHEIGKLRYSEAQSKLQSTFLSKYGNQVYRTLGVFEDLRVDMLMLKSYESAENVYESAIPGILIQKKNFETMSNNLVLTILNNMTRRLNDLCGAYINYSSSSLDQSMREQEIKPLRDALRVEFGEEDFEVAMQKMQKTRTDMMNKATIFDYCAGMIVEAYSLTESTVKDVSKYTEPTKQVIQDVTNHTDTQSVLADCDVRVFPIVEELFADMKDGMKEIAQNFNQGIAQKWTTDGLHGIAQSYNSIGNQQARGVQTSSGRSQENVPREWKTGEYNPIKESVEYEIRSLVNKLTFLKRQEETIRYETNQRRGRLNMKRLYSFRTGNRRLFKRKLTKIDTLRSFAFTLMVDTSGSMYPNRIVHAVRGLVMLSEVFNKMGIPFEIINFEDEATTLKSFSEPYEKKQKNLISGLITQDGGGTTLASALEETKLLQQEENNKVCVILSDGDTESPKKLNKDYFEKWAKKGVKSLAFSIEEGDEKIKELCNGNGRHVKNASQLPEEFSQLLKELINR
jgi:Mg-chelatase subunit ChlD